ncbi:hypothetical protein [Aulosira sp. FACHB-615]|nr:hypothetical protein [Aulosira sp. FACHB-615]MBD2492596.1 hypothetical protein [Aulosira sp. FACHB-615]
MPKAVKSLSGYEDLTRLMREIQLTAGAIASYLETRSDSLPFSRLDGNPP